MGWARGSGIAEEIWGIVREFIPVRKRELVANDIIEVFEDEDADDWDGTSLIEEDAGRTGIEDEKFLEDEN